MKIAQVINSLSSGGAEKLLLDTIPLCRELGIEMDLILLWDNDQPFVTALRNLGCCNIIHINKSSKPSDIYKFKNIIQLRKLLKNYDIVHGHLFPSLYFIRIACIGLDIKLIFTEHNTTNKRIANKLYKEIERWCYRAFDKIVCISNEVKTIYSRYLRMEEKLIVIENGINLSLFQNACSYSKTSISQSIDDSDILLLQVSAFRKQKDQDTLIKSLLYLPKQFKVLLVGDGERRIELEKMVLELDLENRVLFLGQRLDVPNLLKTADIIVLSSYYEGMSLSSIEGMASGKPFIASDVPGLREFVGGYGLLFERGNERELASIVQKVVNDDKLYENVANACIEQANKFDLANTVKKHVQLYEEVTKD